MGRYRRKKRDVGEKAIVSTLRAAGCSVTQLDEGGVPDLVVGRDQKTFLLEVKDEIGVRGGRSNDGQKLTPKQREWFDTWKGHAVVVRTPEEALAAVGITPD